MRRAAEPGVALGLLALFLLATASSCARGSEEPGAAEEIGTSREALLLVPDFGSNAGGSGCASIPRSSAAPRHPAGVVVAMHGCNQTAAAYQAAGWNALADQHGFFVIYPQDGADLFGCFAWFDEAEVSRDGGHLLLLSRLGGLGTLS